MFLARVDGTITSTVKHPSLKSQKLIIAQRMEWDGQEGAGEPVILLDPIGARNGSVVVVSTDGELPRRLTGDNNTPSRFAIIGIVDNPAGKQEAQ